MGLNWVAYKDFRERLLEVEKTNPVNLSGMKGMYTEAVDKAFDAFENDNPEEGLVYMDFLNTHTEGALRSFLQNGNYGDFLNTITKINSGDF